MDVVFLLPTMDATSETTVRILFSFFFIETPYFPDSNLENKKFY